MHQVTAAVLAAIASLRNVAIKVRARVVEMHVANLGAVIERAKSDFDAAQGAKQKALDLYAFACKEINEADAKIREAVAFAKAEAAKHGATLEG
jgi:hypothetical protein